MLVDIERESSYEITSNKFKRPTNEQLMLISAITLI